MLDDLLKPRRVLVGGGERIRAVRVSVPLMQLTKQFVNSLLRSITAREGVEGVVSGASVGCNLEVTAQKTEGSISSNGSARKGPKLIATIPHASSWTIRGLMAHWSMFICFIRRYLWYTTSRCLLSHWQLDFKIRWIIQMGRWIVIPTRT